MHPLYKTVQALEGIAKDHNDESRSLYIALDLTDQALPCKVRSVKAILLHKELYHLMLKYQFKIWLILLKETIPEIPKIMPIVLECKDFQNQIFLNPLGDITLKDILQKTPEGASHFFRSPTLVEWRKRFFEKWPKNILWDESRWNIPQRSVFSKKP